MAATASTLGGPGRQSEVPKLMLGGYATPETITLGLVLLFKLRNRRREDLG